MATEPTTTFETIPTHVAELGEAINQMSEDKSNDWGENISELENVEKEIDALRTDRDRLIAELTRFREAFGSVEDAELQSRYARLGRFTAVSLGANEEWKNNDLTQDIANLWKSLGGEHPLGDQNDAALDFWRNLADQLSIAHDGEAEPEDDVEDEEDEWDEDVCAEDDCDNSLDDGQGYDGYCGDHADQREAAGVYAHHDA